MASTTAPLSAKSRRAIAALLIGAAVLIVAYWMAWFAHRSLVASATSLPYTQFEDAFPAADGWLALCLGAGAYCLVSCRRDLSLRHGCALRHPTRDLGQRGQRQDRAGHQRLDGPGKAILFGRVADVLRPGGRFVMGDVVIPDDPSGAVAPLHPGCDKPSTTAEQVGWLRDAGLDVTVVWTQGDLAVLASDRPVPRR